MAPWVHHVAPLHHALLNKQMMPLGRSQLTPTIFAHRGSHVLILMSTERPPIWPFCKSEN